MTDIGRYALFLALIAAAWSAIAGFVGARRRNSVATRERLARDGGKALIVVTHDFRITQVADRVLWLQDGRWGPAPVESALVSDPVCGMAFPADRSAALRPAGSSTFYFCSDLCAQKFDHDPNAFTAVLEATRKAGNG